MRQCLVRKLLVPAAIVLLVAGCSEAGVTMVKGKVLYNDEPLAGGELEFRPEKDLTLGSFGGARPEHRGRFYSITMAPFPGAGPAPGPIPIYLAAVNDRMAEAAGRVADGVSGHPMTSPRYELSDAQWATIREFLPPNGRRGQQWKDHRLVIWNE